MLQMPPQPCVKLWKSCPKHQDLTCRSIVQDKLQRTQVLECIVLCTESYLRRNAAKPGAEAATERWLARSTKPVMSNLRKGNFQFQEQQVKPLA